MQHVDELARYELWQRYINNALAAIIIGFILIFCGWEWYKIRRDERRKRKQEHDGR